jgi:hypothetical protein
MLLTLVNGGELSRADPYTKAVTAKEYAWPTQNSLKYPEHDGLRIKLPFRTLLGAAALNK